MASRSGGLIVGIHDSDRREDSTKKYTCAMHYANNFEIAECHVHSANGDGICAMGMDGIIRNNVSENGSSWDNGITLFIGCERIRILDNVVRNYGTAIGLDGSYLSAKLPGMTLAESTVICDAKAIELYQNWIGYHRNIEIAGNKLINCSRGIVLWRSYGCNIHNNIIEGRGIGEGFSIEGSIANTIYNNKVRGAEVACRFVSTSFSAVDKNGNFIGSSDNLIGYDMSGNPVGNDFKNNLLGFQFLKPGPKEQIINNKFINNEINGCSSSMPQEDYHYSWKIIDTKK
jgi:parallel beta-helix repeat protein